MPAEVIGFTLVRVIGWTVRCDTCGQESPVLDENRTTTESDLALWANQHQRHAHPEEVLT